ncbi:MAG TPA: PIN domain-containing protein [Sphingobacteriaceae bacterium]
MKHIFMDTNVVIDFLANRQPFALDAARLFDLAINDKATVYVSAVSYNNIYYILRKAQAGNSTMSLMRDLAEITEIVDVTDAVIRQSLKTDFKDYEDAIQYYCALSISRIDFIVTRNTKDFKKSVLPVLSPSEAMASVTSEFSGRN